MKHLCNPRSRFAAGLCAALLASSAASPLTLPQAYAADGEKRQVGDFTYEIFSDYAIVTACKPSSDQIEVPATVEGVPVTGIGSSAFYACDKMKSVKLPDGITYIGDNAFTWCEQMLSITLPANLTEIGHGAFNLCSALTGVALPDALTSIGENAFANCRSLMKITIPDSVTEMGGSAFASCSSLTEVTLSAGLTSIPQSAFSSCAIAELIIPDTVQEIGDSAFASCQSLQTVILSAAVTRIGTEAFAYCSALTDLTIENPNCEIVSEDSIMETATIHGYGGSTANTYANQYGRTFVSLGGEVVQPTESTTETTTTSTTTESTTTSTTTESTTTATTTESTTTSTTTESTTTSTTTESTTTSTTTESTTTSTTTESTTTSTTTTPLPHVGDVNGDGKLNLSDAVLIYRLVNEDPEVKMALPTLNLAQADCDQDDCCTIADVLALLWLLKP